jgi:hypothetical protein
MASHHFSPDDFTPTQFSTAEQKAAFANQLVAFIAAGFPEKRFTKALYERLSNCFGFIAYLNRIETASSKLSSPVPLTNSGSPKLANAPINS